MWLPHQDSPGLAMSRAFGDFVLKNHGIIAVPDISYRRLASNDRFLVLATDGVSQSSAINTPKIATSFFIQYLHPSIPMSFSLGSVTSPRKFHISKTIYNSCQTCVTTSVLVREPCFVFISLLNI